MKKSISILLFLIILIIGTMNLIAAQESGNTVTEPMAMSVKQADFQKMRSRLKNMTPEERQEFVDRLQQLTPQEKRAVAQRIREIVEDE